MDVSVLLPVRNAGKYLPLAVKSIISQMTNRDELIIFDDDSNEATKKIISSIKDPRVLLTGSKVNVGVSFALSSMLELAQNPYIARMDADDVSLPGRLRHQKSEIENFDLDFHFTNVVLFRSGFVAPQVSSSLDTARLHRILPFSNPLAHPTLMGRVSTIRELGGYLPGSAQDYSLWLRAALNGSSMRRSNRLGLARRLHSAQSIKYRKFPPALEIDELRVQLLKHVKQVDRDFDLRVKLLAQNFKSDLELLNSQRALFSIINSRHFLGMERGRGISRL